MRVNIKGRKSMNTGILLIELLILIIAFSAEVIISIIKNPEAWVADYPPEIQAEYYKTHENKREKLTKEMIVRNAVPVCVDGAYRRCAGIYRGSVDSFSLSGVDRCV